MFPNLLWHRCWWRGSGVLAEVAAARGAVGAGLQPLHDVLQVAAVAAALAPDEEPLHHVVAHGAHAGALPAPAAEKWGEKEPGKAPGGMQRGNGVRGPAPSCWVLLPRRGTPERDPGEGPPSSHPHRSQIQPLLLMGLLQLLQLMCRVVEAWLRQLMARQVLSLITSLEMFQSWKRCSRSM